MQLQGKLNPTESALRTSAAQNSEEQADNLKPSNNILQQGQYLKSIIQSNQHATKFLYSN